MAKAADSEDDPATQEQDFEYFSCNFRRILLAIFNPQSETKIGRAFQLLWTIVLSTVATAGIVVQIYTDIEENSLRVVNSANLQRENKIAFQIYDIAELLSSEMEPFYKFNKGDYDLFLDKAQSIMTTLDTKLIYTEEWPSDLSALPVDARENVSSSSALRSALKAQRELRKSPNGTAEADVINFYSTLIDNLGAIARTMTLNAQRFPGWRDYLSIVLVVQTLANFKKVALIGSKLSYENRTISSVYDPVYLSLINYNLRYGESLSLAAIDSPYTALLLDNLTQQDPAKDMDKLFMFVDLLDFGSIDGFNWDDVSQKHITNIKWVLLKVKERVNTLMQIYATTWTKANILSICLIAISGAFVILNCFLQFFATWRLQRQISNYHKTLARLNEVFTGLYDYIPFGLVHKTIIEQEVQQRVRHFPDTCILVLDVSNAILLVKSLEATEFAELLCDFFHTVETCLLKYNCFKVDVHGEGIILGAGIGERHIMDHVLEMVFAALDLRDSVVEKCGTNQHDGSNQKIQIQIGINVGPCYSKIVNLQVLRVGFAGDVTLKASILSSHCFPLKVLVSAALFQRLEFASEELEFFRRDPPINVGDNKETKMKAYWVDWKDDKSDILGDDGTRSVVSSRKRD